MIRAFQQHPGEVEPIDGRLSLIGRAGRAALPVAVLIVTCGLPAAVICGQDIYHTTPDWVSADTQVSTGAALADLDRDGWLDLIVSNGNDMAQQRLAVYYNQAGTLPPSPNWQSADVGYNGHLDVADVNGDGWPDVAVATLGEFSTTGPIARVYLNNLGTLSSTPNWTANVIGNAFGLAFGDMNNDGRPDLAVATGWAYGTPHLYNNYVYLNVGGMLASTPSWTSTDTYDTQGALWVDADDDGWLDLVLAAANTRSRMYRNLGGMLETTASWQVTDVSNQDCIMATAGDVTGDGRRDLILADNNQIAGGSGRFRQYNGTPLGGFAGTAAWTYYEGYCSAVALADLNCDGRLDLATGAWWDRTRLFLNAGSGFGSNPSWNSAGTSVVEKIVFGDVDKDGLRPVQTTFTSVPVGRRLFYLPYQPIQEVTAVLLDGQPLGPSQYTVGREHGWLTIGADVTASLVVQYTVSSRLEMAITNWDSNKGNYLYYNQRLVVGDGNCDGQFGFGDINPFILLLLDTYDQVYPDCDGHLFCDMNGDGTVNFADINPFIAALLGS